MPRLYVYINKSLYVFVPQLQKFQEHVEKMYNKNIFNLETMKEKLRYLSNRIQSCRTIPQDFRSKFSHLKKKKKKLLIGSESMHSLSFSG